MACPKMGRSCDETATIASAGKGSPSSVYNIHSPLRAQPNGRWLEIGPKPLMRGPVGGEIVTVRGGGTGRKSVAQPDARKFAKVALPSFRSEPFRGAKNRRSRTADEMRCSPQTAAAGRSCRTL